MYMVNPGDIEDYSDKRRALGRPMAPCRQRVSYETISLQKPQARGLLIESGAKCL
jgi:hypothetical protein